MFIEHQIIKLDVTLKTGEIPAENVASPSQE